jgi:hypothetical protein
VVLRSLALRDGPWNAVVFVATVLVVHRSVALLGTRHRWIRHLVRGRPGLDPWGWPRRTPDLPADR